MMTQSLHYCRHFEIKQEENELVILSQGYRFTPVLLK